MREIKFRAWDKAKKKFIKASFNGDILIGGDYIAIINNRPDNGGYTIDNIKILNWIEKRNIEISQYTGLKDKNGKEIYEGDIVRKDEGYYGCYSHKVEYKDGYFYPLVDVEEGYNSISKYCSDYIEVIGNIYENPELLQK